MKITNVKVEMFNWTSEQWKTGVGTSFGPRPGSSESSPSRPTRESAATHSWDRRAWARTTTRSD